MQCQVASRLGPGAFVEGSRHRMLERLPGRRALQLERGGAAHALGGQQAARRRVGRAHAGAPVDHQHAVGHLLDHQAVQLRLLPRELQAAARGQFLARQPARQFAGQQGDHEEADAGQPGLREARHVAPSSLRAATRSPAAAGPRPPWWPAPAMRAVSTPAISTGSTSSGDVVEACRRAEQVQRREDDQVDADGGGPLPAGQAGHARRPAGAREARQQPQAHGLHGVAQAQEEQRRARSLGRPSRPPPARTAVPCPMQLGRPRRRDRCGGRCWPVRRRSGGPGGSGTCCPALRARRASPRRTRIPRRTGRRAASSLPPTPKTSNHDSSKSVRRRSTRRRSPRRRSCSALSLIERDPARGAPCCSRCGPSAAAPRCAAGECRTGHSAPSLRPRRAVTAGAASPRVACRPNTSASTTTTTRITSRYFITRAAARPRARSASPRRPAATAQRLHRASAWLAGRASRSHAARDQDREGGPAQHGKHRLVVPAPVVAADCSPSSSAALTAPRSRPRRSGR